MTRLLQPLAIRYATRLLQWVARRIEALAQPFHQWDFVLRSRHCRHVHTVPHPYWCKPTWDGRPPLYQVFCLDCQTTFHDQADVFEARLKRWPEWFPDAATTSADSRVRAALDRSWIQEGPDGHHP